MKLPAPLPLKFENIISKIYSKEKNDFNFTKAIKLEKLSKTDNSRRKSSKEKYNFYLETTNYKNDSSFKNNSFVLKTSRSVKKFNSPYILTDSTE